MIDYLFITHHHYDHICDLGEVLMSAWHNGRQKPIQIYGPKGTEALITSLFTTIFVHDIRFAQFIHPEEPHPLELIRVKDIASGWQLELENLKLSTAAINHGNSLGIPDWHCLAYKLETPLSTLVIAGDAAYSDDLAHFCLASETLLISCYLAKEELFSKAFRQSAKHVIIASDQVGKLATHAGVRRLILTHFRPKTTELMHSLVRAVKADFSGELIIAEDLLTLEL